MDLNLSISSFKKKPPAGFLSMLMFIFLFEAMFVFIYPHAPWKGDGYWNKNNRNKVGQIPPGGSPAKVVIIGDSTSSNSMIVKKYGIANSASLGGLICSYYLLRKFIENNGRPELCVLLFNDMWWEMEDVMPNSFYRPFFAYDKMFEFIFIDKKPDLAWRMFENGFMPSRRYRMPIISLLEKYSLYNSNTVKFKAPKETVVANNVEFDWKKHYLANDTRMRKGFLLKVSQMQGYYFDKICDLLQKNNIKLVVWESAIPRTRADNDIYFSDYMKDVNEFMRARREFILSYETRCFVFEDEVFISDGTHVKGGKEEIVADAIYEKILPFLAKSSLGDSEGNIDN